MTIVAEALHVEILRYAYALSMIRWLDLLTHTTVAGLVTALVIVVWGLRVARRDASRRGGVRSLTKAHRARASGA